MRAFTHIAIIGTGLIGSSVARAVREKLPESRLSGFDRDPATRQRAEELGLFDAVHSDYAPLAEADLVLLCVPVGAMAAVGRDIAPHIGADAIISDVGSCKASVLNDLRSALPDATIIPAHPVAGTEKSGPDAGFASLFEGRWCIITPDDNTDESDIARLEAFWSALGANVERMDAEHHDLVLAVTSHLPHLIAYTIVGTASDLESVTRSEVIKYSAGGFRDFTRIAASDPVMWRDVFLSNREAVLDMLQRFTEDLTALQRAIRRDEGDTLEDLFTRTRAIRRGIIDEGQDVAEPDFGRDHG
ncbi:prephenate/arogenate dehydrogenase family protein [Alterisphingorhabdus coralli]|uniref:prephenate dehydrogenase n=1 Tax=Alterisphingorhabdus coralli TaxID=3071408 RepID=A0AA97F755_9SPHN|nr:prephenate/arogenate dehydrogenase family protein [Parasphingorhabdus sp. SCSIO 66989]WOE75431.1 prephenate/arogenate dehydrogenase family protein [Parasphingorhabdus sp. SCSIO 66989]